MAEGRLAGAGGTWDVLYHFCKHNDARRQDPIAVIRSLACQLCSLPSKLGEHAAAGERMRCRQPAAALPTGLDSGTCDTQNRLCPNAAAGLVGLTADQIREAFKSVDAAFDLLLLKPLTSAAEAGLLSPSEQVVSHLARCCAAPLKGGPLPRALGGGGGQGGKEGGGRNAPLTGWRVWLLGVHVGLNQQVPWGW